MCDARIEVVNRGEIGLVLAAAALVGRGGSSDDVGNVTSASCHTAPYAATAVAGESGVYRAGPLVLAVGEDLAQTLEAPASHPQGSEAVAIVAGTRTTVVRVLPARGVRLALLFEPASQRGPSPKLTDGVQAIRFPTCPGSPRRFAGGLIFAGHGCARLKVWSSGDPAATLLIPLAGSLRNCPSRSARASLPDSSLQFLGVACARPNWIGCDRVGVGVHANQRATLVTATIAGHLVTLSPPLPDEGSDLWLGYLEHAGLRGRGPLRVLPRRGDRWFGSPEVYARVQVRAWLPDGRVASSVTKVLLHPGFR